MMVVFSKLILLSFFLTAPCFAAAKNQVDLTFFSMNFVKDSLFSFAKENRTDRYPGSAGHQKAFLYLQNIIKKNDPLKTGSLIAEEFVPRISEAQKMFQDDFDKEIKGKFKPSSPEYDQWNRFTLNMQSLLASMQTLKGQNLIWEKKGKNPKKIFVIGAHYDTLTFDFKQMTPNRSGSMPGVDNNGTGVVLLLNLITLLAKTELDVTVRVIFFDMQEEGRLGSLSHMADREKEYKDELEFLGFINPLMLGHDTKDQDKTLKLGNYKIYYSESTFTKEDQFVKDFKSKSELSVPEITLTPMANNFKTSDAFSFSQKGLPALTISHDWENDFNEQYHHSPSDLLETINLRSYHQVSLKVMRAVLSMVSGR